MGSGLVLSTLFPDITSIQLRAVSDELKGIFLNDKDFKGYNKHQALSEKPREAYCIRAKF